MRQVGALAPSKLLGPDGANGQPKPSLACSVFPPRFVGDLGHTGRQIAGEAFAKFMGKLHHVRKRQV
jgi:hypothetical protein